ncbi:hypothetical protein B0H16DRAFT_256407 [Mycena metata]|uniref:Uncharacterized protein n=1 Tax=Mycena metata TaxID=1033252 RepID=A0AAD7JQR2_9AGAR|nr:hypothetical protein B0H16DRAFT_256407 [Mycena metata]
MHTPSAFTSQWCSSPTTLLLLPLHNPTAPSSLLPRALAVGIPTIGLAVRRWGFSYFTRLPYVAHKLGVRVELCVVDLVCECATGVWLWLFPQRSNPDQEQMVLPFQRKDAGYELEMYSKDRAELVGGCIGEVWGTPTNAHPTRTFPAPDARRAHPACAPLVTIPQHARGPFGVHRMALVGKAPGKEVGH